MTIEELNKKHRKTIDEMGNRSPHKNLYSAVALRECCQDAGVKDSWLLSLDDALTEAGKLLAPKPDPLPPMPWAFNGVTMYDANRVSWLGWTASQLQTYRTYIASCGTADVRLIVESGLAGTIAEALRKGHLLRDCGHNSWDQMRITLPETKR